MPRKTTAALTLALLITASHAGEGGQPPAQPTPPPTPPAPTKPEAAKPIPKVVEPKPAQPTGAPSKPQPLDPKKQFAEAKTNTVYEAVSTCAGYTEDGQDRVGLLKYTWVLPDGFQRGQPRDVIIVLHGYGLDHTWAPYAMPAADLAPGAIVVSVDGTRETDASEKERFPGLDAQDTLLMRDFVLEMTRTFPTAKIILAGHSQGAFGMVLLANRFPRLFNGVVAYGGGVPDTRLGGMRVVPAAFVHGTADELVPLRIAVEGRDALIQAGAKAAVLRRVVGGGHAPDVKEAALGIAWVRGMVTENPVEALDSAKTLLSIKSVGVGPAGEIRTPAFGMALSILQRFTADPASTTAWPRATKDPTEDQKKEAAALAMTIEAQGLRQVAALRTALPDAAALRAATFAPDTPTPNWLGHVLSLREDFKGVECVDAFMKELKYDELLAEHEEAERAIVIALETEEWGGGGLPPKDAFAAVIESLPKAYLVEGLPRNLEATMKDWGKRADELKIPADQRDLLPVVSQYLSAVKKGRDRYHEINKEWK